MKYLLTGEQMRQADHYTMEHIGIPSMVLMERAALKVVEIIEQECEKISTILVVCGNGNNGGDGYAIARLLHLKGYHVSIYFAGTDVKRSEENQKQKDIAEYYCIPVKQNLEEQEYSVIIDAIFGTGLRRNIEGKYAEVIDRLNQMSGYKVAVDLPSGINDETGCVMGAAFYADLTVAFAFLKRGHMIVSNHPHVGKVVIADIGINEDAIPKDDCLTYCYDFSDFQARFPARIEQSHKGTYGKVLLIVGSQGMAGAALLSARAAYMVGAGLVQIYTHEDNRVIIQESLPEAVLTTYDTYDEEELNRLLAWADVVGIGCGLGMSEVAHKIVQHTIACTEVPCVADADALHILASEMVLLKNRKAPLVITPHIKEMSRLLSCEVKDVVEHKMNYLEEFVKTYELTCVLKDARTIVAQKQEKFFLNLTGNSAMAKGGSGDILAGIISGILAQGMNTYESACLGVYLHGLCGDFAKEQKGKYSVLAGDIVESIGEILRQI